MRCNPTTPRKLAWEGTMDLMKIKKNNDLNGLSDKELATLWRSQKVKINATIERLELVRLNTKGKHARKRVNARLRLLKKRIEILKAGNSRHMSKIGEQGRSTQARRRKQTTRRNNKAKKKAEHEQEVAMRKQRREQERLARQQRNKRFEAEQEKRRAEIAAKKAKRDADSKALSIAKMARAG